MMQLRMAACTDPGARSGNEDDLRHGRSANGSYAVLADGAGGHSRGEEASRRTVECIEQVLNEDGVDFSPANLSQIVRMAHTELQQRQSSKRPESRMHTTVVVLWIDTEQRHALWTHVGDSRLYRLRRGRAEQLTQDDSVVQHMVQAGMISAEEARQHPNKNHLLAALGTDGEIEPHTVARPVELMEGDAYLLCSDGWWDGFELKDLESSLGRASAPEDWLHDMQQQVRARAAPRQDNFSAIALWVGDPADVTLLRADDTISRGTTPS